MIHFEASAMEALESIDERIQSWSDGEDELDEEIIMGDDLPGDPYDEFEMRFGFEEL